jgi:hypothetical protein
MSQSPDAELAEAADHVRRLSRLAYVAIGVAVVVIAAYIWNFAGLPASDEQDKWGQFGDYVGGLLNPTFSFLALLALLSTLGLQVRELKLSVRELANSADALSKQNETLKLQAFEGTFFQALKLHNDIVSSMEVTSQALKGRACFVYFLSQLEGELINNSADKHYDTFLPQYDVFYLEFQSSLGHYFRLLYNIVKLIKRTEGIDQRFYTNFVRAQLSSAELKLIFYNCLSNWGREKFKPLVEEFALLKTIPNETLPDNALLHQYSPEAFGGQYPESWLL